jgi:hypothetical protein
MRSLLLLTLTLAMTMTMNASSEEFDHVTYRGKEIALSRVYADFHDYRDDPDNLPTAVRPMVAELVRTAPVAITYPNRQAIGDALYLLMFPGYGYSMLGLDQPIALFSLEVPYASEQRFILFIPSNGTWKLTDDFLWPDAGGLVVRAVRDGDVIHYCSPKGDVLRDKVISSN